MLSSLNNFKDLTIAIIPARAGSTRIKNKNLCRIGNDSLITNSLKTCKKSGIFDQIIVSTDSKEIAKHSENFSSLIHNRSQANAQSLSSTESVISEIFNDLPELFDKQVLIYLIQCTSPFLKEEDLIRSYELIKSNKFNYDCLVSGYLFNKFIWEKDTKTKNLIPLNYNPQERPRSQDKSPLFVENGAFYVFGASNFKLTKCRIHGRVASFEMDEKLSIDIDSQEDLNYAIYLSDYLKG